MVSILDQGDGYYGFINKLSGKSLDLLDWDTSEGANIAQWELVNDTGVHLLSGDVKLKNVTFTEGQDKFVYVRGQSNISIENCAASNAAKLLRQAGGETVPVSWLSYEEDNIIYK